MKIIKISNTGLTFDDGTIVSHYHDQDCCESVYADWKSLKDQYLIGNNSPDFSDITIEKVANSGFRLIDSNKNGYFVPCYNYQNGYYSSNLSLTIERTNQKEEVIDISDCVEDHID